MALSAGDIEVSELDKLILVQYDFIEPLVIIMSDMPILQQTFPTNYERFTNVPRRCYRSSAQQNSFPNTMCRNVFRTAVQFDYVQCHF